MTDDNDDSESSAPDWQKPAPKGNDYAKGHGHGAPEGNQNSVGNPGGDGAPEGNKRAMEHGLYAVKDSPGETFEWLQENEPENAEWIVNKAEGYLEEAPFDRKSAKYDQLLQVATREYAIWKATGIQMKEGIIKKTHKRTPDGEYIEVEDENPVNKSLDRMENRVSQKLKKLGIYDDQDSGSSKDLENEYYTVVDATPVEDED